MYQTLNPFTQQVEKKFSTITDTSLTSKLSKSKETFKEWKGKNFQSRSTLLDRVAELLEERKDTYGRLMSLEMGKPISQARAEVEKCAWVCSYYADNAVDFLKTRRIDSDAQLTQIVYEPLGAIFAVMPWNFPFWQVFRFAAPAIMAGNTALLKHASNVPQCAQAIEQVFLDAGAPKGLFQNLFISHKQVETVIASDTVKAITLTGSNEAGARVAELAGRYTKKSVLELGGSDPFIVFDDADMHSVLEKAIMSRFLNSGQSCIAAKRFIVHEDIADEFISNFQSLVENLTYGNPMDENTYIAPLVNAKALKEVDKMVKESIEKGAECITGGSVYEDISTIYKPTILINVPEDAPVWKDEVFGPVAPVVIFSDEEEAIRLANNTPFGLGASVWTQDMDRAEWMSKNIEAGTVTINEMVKSDPRIPFGGIKASGYGRELSDYGIYEFVNIKTENYFE